MTLEKCLELIKILESEIADEKTPIEEKEFNINWIRLIRKSISISFDKAMKKSEKRHKKIFK